GGGRRGADARDLRRGRPAASARPPPPTATDATRCGTTSPVSLRCSRPASAQKSPRTSASAPSSHPHLGRRHRRTDIPVRAEKIPRIHPRFDLREPVEVGSIGAAHPLVPLVRRLEIHVGAAGRERLDSPPRVAYPLAEFLGARLIRRPHAFDADREAYVPIPD